MELDWTTFALEIVNFLVLVWLLSRFLYRPLAAAIAARRAAVERGMQEAREAKQQAAALQADVQARLAEWENEKAKAKAALEVELGAERSRRLEALQAELEKARSRDEALARREAAEGERKLERRVLEQGASFCARLLAPLAGPEVEARIVELAGAELERLPAARREALRANGPASAQVTSAYPLAEAQHQRVERALSALAGHGIACVYGEDKSLIAGLRIQLGPWIFGANLRDELVAFTESARGRA